MMMNLVKDNYKVLEESELLSIFIGGTVIY